MRVSRVRNTLVLENQEHSGKGLVVIGHREDRFRKRLTHIVEKRSLVERVNIGFSELSPSAGNKCDLHERRYKSLGRCNGCSLFVGLQFARSADRALL